MSEEITEYQAIRAAVLMIYKKSDRPTQKLLEVCELKVGPISDYWDLRIIAPNKRVWIDIYERIEFLLARMDEVMGRFCISLCKADNPIPIEVEKKLNWTEKEHFCYGDKKYVELRGKWNKDWVTVISKDLLEERWLKVVP